MRIFGLVLFALMLVPAAFAVNVGSGIGIDIHTEDFVPLIWMCDSRAVYDDATEPGRVSMDGTPLVERYQNYAFEGEQISWTVLVMDKNGIQKVKDVYASVGPYRNAREFVSFKFNDSSCMNNCQVELSACITGCDQFLNQTNSTQYDACVLGCEAELPACQSTCERTGQRLEQNDIEANCVEASNDQNFESCNARILEEKLTGFDSSIMRYYDCTLTVETPLSMYGEYFITVEVEDLDGEFNHADEVEYWFLNPVVAIGIDGSIVFENVRPGTQVYSGTMLVTNEADRGSGVLLDMFISGTDFYDSSSSGAACPNSNVLSLQNFAYWSANGAYSTQNDPRADAEGYVPILYGIGFNDPNPFYGTHEIIQSSTEFWTDYVNGNVLSPGSSIGITYRVDLPEPCNGDFDSGSIYIWGEAI